MKNDFKTRFRNFRKIALRMPPKKQKYVSVDPIEHILLRPDMYIGSVENVETEQYVADEKYKIRKRSITVSDGIMRIFIEPLSNAIDNVARSKKSKTKVTEIRVEIGDDGRTTIRNDGEYIPVEINKDEGKIYNHTLVFGKLLTGSNYDDTEDRENISGRNGVGVKCTNAFSTFFQVQGSDPEHKKLLIQTWTSNMKKTDGPKISSYKNKTGYTVITYIPDFERFGLSGYTPDIIDSYRKLLIDTAMITQINVYFNNELIPVKSLVEYSKLYFGDAQKQGYLRDNRNEVHLGDSDIPYVNMKGQGCNVLVCPSFSDEFQAVSFANGICTSEGGTHVDAWVEAVLRPIVEKINSKKNVVTIRDVRKFFSFFIVATVSQPKFETQSKRKMTSPKIVAEVKKNQISTIMKWNFMETIEELIRTKDLLVLKKIEKKRAPKVATLDSANNEGGPHASECTIILVEGLSAKTYATHGIENGAFGKAGRDWFGIYAMRGKILNTRNVKTAEKIQKNLVICDIINALGLRIEADYRKDSEYKKLRYGKVMIITDADVDGIHISGLVQNLFHSLYPSLLERKDSFLTAMQTPIVRVYISPKKSLLFYDETEYRRYVREQYEKGEKKIRRKYYKGLGTNTEDDIQDSFGVKLIRLKSDEKILENMTKAFHKDHADLRKKWLELYDPTKSVLKWKGNEREIVDLKMSDFINTELIKFSIDDCKRSIPNIMDGLKEGNRKVLYSTFLKKLSYTKKSIKVEQLAGYVSQKTSYSHGEHNLHLTITHMAQAYIGSNNIPYFVRDGIFGSRSEGGKDAAAGRYIWTKLDMLTRLIFRPEDDVLLDYREDDGEKIEPHFYVPILPMTLVNGNICGIGTGWSSNIPCYNPKDLMMCIRMWLEADGNMISVKDDTIVSQFPDIIPWYRGHRGKMLKTDDSSKFVSEGVIEETKKGCVITELPVGVWTSSYRAQLDTWEYEKKIKSYKNHSDPKDVYFEIVQNSNGGLNMTVEDLKLSKDVRCTNMCLFTEEEKLKKYNTPDEIIDNFCKVRYEYYIRRKKYYLGKLEYDIKFLGNKRRFLMEIRDKKISLSEERGGKTVFRKTQSLVEELDARGYDKMYKYGVDLIEDDGKEDEDETVQEEEEDEKGQEKGYDYLLKLQFRNITEEKIKALKKDIDTKQEELELMKATTEKQMWIRDLEEFEKAYEAWLPIINKEKIKKSADTFQKKKKKP